MKAKCLGGGGLLRCIKTQSESHVQGVGASKTPLGSSPAASLQYHKFVVMHCDNLIHPKAVPN